MFVKKPALISVFNWGPSQPFVPDFRDKMTLQEGDGPSADAGSDPLCACPLQSAWGDVWSRAMPAAHVAVGVLSSTLRGMCIFKTSCGHIQALRNSPMSSHDCG